ncbi:Putative uncharacterized protein [Leuconostoc citreum]|uniref:Uncharacterized protein n=1 Tax=Leuconostoc citreum (strain KM20) TaxID=349519 RepID=B1MZB3_LEUCK|nr:hypothetical protein [Leuconostoc citreum]ACA82865.1 Hypothetical protein LCK_01038 [Leuconostoc citreum KM20]CDX64454.1 Putative uncharacterized protein [Leuconostoc citreum]
MEVDAQKIINNLGMQLANKSVENATLAAQLETLQEQLKEANADKEK